MRQFHLAIQPNLLTL